MAFNLAAHWNNPMSWKKILMCGFQPQRFWFKCLGCGQAQWDFKKSPLGIWMCSQSWKNWCSYLTETLILNVCVCIHTSMYICIFVYRYIKPSCFHRHFKIGCLRLIHLFVAVISDEINKAVFPVIVSTGVRKSSPLHL